MSKATQIKREYSCVCTVTIVASTHAETREKAKRKLSDILFGVVKRDVQVEDGRFFLLESDSDGVKSTVARMSIGKISPQSHNELEQELAGHPVADDW
ncbi:hypothetical protein [Rhodoplanes sp. SY1]|uniref:hypothetical protein n=1 Tax=Rhodoplanes sp. SY1 TaxID=3166646 RepID=UPI0038B4BF74